MTELKILWGHFEKRRKTQSFFVVLLMLVSSIAEIVSLGMVIPFLAILTKPESLFQNEYAQPIIELLGINSVDQILLPVTILFILASIIANAIRILLIYVFTKFSFALGADLSIKIYRNALYQNYAWHTSHNSSEIINGIINKTNLVTSGILFPLFSMVSGIIVIAAILVVLFSVDIMATAVSLSVFGFLYWVVILYTHRTLNKNSQCIADKTTYLIKSLQEGLGGIRDVIIDNTQNFYCEMYHDADISTRKASASNNFISASPRYIMEAVGVTLIAGFAYILNGRDAGLVDSIPMLGALALGAQRLLPLLQQTYSAYSSIKGAYSSFIDTLNFLKPPFVNYKDEANRATVSFKNSIHIKNLNFQYGSDSPIVLKGVDLTLKKGSCIGIMGKTGSGKSTLLDIIMGLLITEEGSFFVDDTPITSNNIQHWRSHISHVPQVIYLADDTIEGNIAFGVPKDQIDYDRVRHAANQAQISEFIEGLSGKYKAFVGECGVRLSGGQRQRIGIARALYKKSDVIVFDEATSALDSETELQVMKSIEEFGEGNTIIIIAHRLSTLKNCDQIIELSEGGILQIGTYKDVVY